MPAPALLLPLAVLAAAASPADPAFAAEWRRWHEQRIERLRRPDGWLALSGLHWLEPGPNRVPGLPGTFTLERGVVTLSAAAGDGYRLGDAPVAVRALATDATPAPDRLAIGSCEVMVIARGDRLALRVWDAESPTRKGFRGIPAFPPDPRWRLAARWEAYAAPREVEVPSVVGIATRERIPGRAWFTLEGRELSLEATLEDGQLFFVFRDRTAGRETYGAGRFLMAGPPEAGTVILDFNRAYNPPCAFTPHATCPLPPPRNVLPVRVEAGEKRVREG